MVPDDPLGRGGPHLDDFLRSAHRYQYRQMAMWWFMPQMLNKMLLPLFPLSTLQPGNQPFAGVAPTSDPLKASRSQTKVLHSRNQPPGVAVNVGRGGGRGRGRKRDSNAGPQNEWVARDRSPGETASLREQLHRVFSGQDNTVALVLQSCPAETDINVLSELILEQHKDQMEFDPL